MLILQDDDALFESVSRLIADKKEEKRSLLLVWVFHKSLIL